MALRADFEVIKFNSHLGDNAGDLNVPWTTFQGNQTPVRSFVIGQRPIGAGYLLVQAFDVDNENHRILINGIDLGGWDIASDGGWQTWMDVIESGVLQQGNNTIQFIRAGGNDNFVIASVVVNWREVV